MPKQVTRLTDQCATDACERDTDGYCKVQQAVDRACVCRNINYDSCKGPCQTFEARKDYTNWLHGLCGGLQDWSGLPDNWRHLAAPTSMELIPWQWTLKSIAQSNTTSPTLPDSRKVGQTCPSNDWKLGSIVLINIATVLAIFFGRRSGVQHPRNWALKGISIAILQTTANWFNAMFVQTTPGYEDVPIIQLMLLWCTLPRLTWLPTTMIGVQPFEAITVPAAASALLAEVVLQFAALYYMLTTISYGLEHDLYFGGMEGAVRETPATLMYLGALLWLLTSVAALAQLLRSMSVMTTSTESHSSDLPSWQRRQQTSSTIVEEAVAQLDERSTLFGENVTSQWIKQNTTSPLKTHRGGQFTAYGTFPDKAHDEIVISPEAFVQPYLVIVTIMFVFWIAQWMFWAGFIRLSSEEFCPPNLGILTAVWVVASVTGVVVGAS